MTVADTSVLFGMIGRDIAGELPYILANIARLAEHFKEAHVVFVENDSADDTRGVFHTWAAAFTSGSAHNRTVKVLGFTPSTAGHKNPKLLAQARNRYLEQLVQPEYVAVNFLIAVDTDMCFPWDVKNMLKVINALLPAAGEAWHALYANGACGWYKDFFGSNKEEVPFFTAGECAVWAAAGASVNHHLDQWYCCRCLITAGIDTMYQTLLKPVKFMGFLLFSGLAITLHKMAYPRSCSKFQCHFCRCK